MEIQKIKLPKGKGRGKAYIIDNYFSYFDMRFIYSTVLQGPFNYTQMSEPLSNIRNYRFSQHIEGGDNRVNMLLRKAVDDITQKILPKKQLTPSEIYVNIADAMTVTLPHTDRPKECWTLLYYPNIEWDIKYGGQTNFIDQETMDILAAVVPKPGRFILFRADLLHQATPPTFYAPDKRLTIAMKLDPYEILDNNEHETKEKDYVTTNSCWN